jgi:hypothetical protein
MSALRVPIRAGPERSGSPDEPEDNGHQTSDREGVPSSSQRPSRMTLTWALGGSVCITFLMELSSIQPSISPILREELAHVLPQPTGSGANIPEGLCSLVRSREEPRSSPVCTLVRWVDKERKTRMRCNVPSSSNCLLWQGTIALLREARAQAADVRRRCCTPDRNDPVRSR